jgi:predicted permease
MGFVRELKFAAASLRRAPTFVAAVVITLGVTLGTLITTAVLSYVLVFKPLPYADSERLYLVKGTLQNNGAVVMANVNSYASARELYGRKQEFQAAALLAFEPLQYSSHARQPLFTVSFVSPEFFGLLQTPMAMGRAFADSERVGSFNPVAVISYKTWQQYFEGRADVLEQSIDLNGKSYRIVGVSAERFDEPHFFSGQFQGSEVWLPWDFHRGDERARNDWGALIPAITVIARLADGVGSEQATQVVSDGLNRAFRANLPNGGEGLPYSMSVQLSSFEEVILGDSSNAALLLLAGAFTLLFIACSNIVNLMLSRTVQKQKQLTIQATVGANRKHLFMSILAENALLMAGVAALSVAATYWGFDVLRGLATGYMPRLGELSLGIVSTLLTLVLAGVLALIFSAAAIRIVKYDQLQSSVQSSGKGSGLQISARVQSLLIASQIALMGLLIAANMSVLKGATDVILRPLGFETRDLAFLSLDYQAGEIDAARREQLSREVLATLQSHPQVEVASATTSEPTRPSNGGPVFRFADDRSPTNVVQFYTSARYFEVMRQPMLEGRGFTAAEAIDKGQVAVVTRSLAKKLYPGTPVLGKTVVHSAHPKPYSIVGVVDDLSLPPSVFTVQGGEEMNRQHLYMPGYSVPNVLQMRFLIKLKPGQEADKAQWQAAFKRIDPNLNIWMLEDMDERRLQMVAHELTTAKITVALTVISMLLAGIGIYGVLNYNTELRRYELGVRMSLGARPADIVKLIFLGNARPVLWGFGASTLLGIAAYSVARRYMDRYMQIEIVPLFAAVALILLIAALSSYLPIHKLVRRWPIYAWRE